MAELNVLTFNSGGETEDGARRLKQALSELDGMGRAPHVIVIQEANLNGTGPVESVLTQLNPHYYAQPPVKVPEGGSHGRAYLMITHQGLQVTVGFSQINLAYDNQLNQVISRMAPVHQTTARQVLSRMRMPAAAAMTAGNRGILFVTWHVPRGPGELLTGATLQGGANPDAFWFFQNSGFYGSMLTSPGHGNIGVIAGDLNVTTAQLNDATGIHDLPELLPGWDGLSDNLDHIVGYTEEGDAEPGFPFDLSFTQPGQHSILAGTVSW
jgi:hypothetical protein